MFNFIVDDKMDESTEILSPKFYEQFHNDHAKKSILHPKYILDSLGIWPERRGKSSYYLSIIYMTSLFLMEIGHVSYFIINISDLTEMAESGTTVVSTFQALLKTWTIMANRKKLQKILCEIWFNFWPVDIVKNPKVKSEIKNRTLFLTSNMYAYLSLAYLSVFLFMAFDMVLGTRHLPLASSFPFSWDESPTYEILYLWQWFTNMYVIIILTSFDYFFMALVTCCSAQFQILQEVLRNIYVESKYRKTLIKKLGFGGNARPNVEELFLKCHRQHKKLIMICKSLEEVFTSVILMQFFSSTMSICVSSFVLKVDPDKFSLMGTYVAAHIMQLFMYCCIGNELIYQSVALSDGAFYCNWHLINSKYLTKSLITLIQRSHRREQLTALGFTELSYSSFIRVCKLSFSFYTALDALMNKRKL